MITERERKKRVKRREGSEGLGSVSWRSKGQSHMNESEQEAEWVCLTADAKAKSFKVPVMEHDVWWVVMETIR